MTCLSKPFGKDAARLGGGEHGRNKQAGQDALEVEAPVEAVLQFAEVSMRVLGKVKRVEGACEAGLQ